MDQLVLSNVDDKR